MAGARRSLEFDLARVPVVHVLTLSGFALIGLGVFLPWVGETPARVYVLGMESGFERQWGRRLLLGAVLGTALVLLSLSSRAQWSVIGPILSAIGAATVVIAVYTTPLTGPWPSEIGVYLTLAGGLLVACTPLVALGRNSQRYEAEAPD